MTSLWPDETQSLLLHAALDDGDRAIEAFETWQSRIDFADHLDPGSFRLLPLLHHNLKRLGHQTPLMMMLAGVFRYNWVAIQKLHDDAARLAELLGAANIPVMVNKGLTLGICYYDHPALRPMSDVDLMVPGNHVLEAAAILQDSGWRICHAGRENITWRDIVEYRHSVGFRDAKGNEMDLHWSPSSELRGDEIENAFWQGALPMQVRDQTVLRPSATCMILHTALHGVRFNEMPPLRWIADFKMILQKDAELVDWNLLVSLARMTRTSSRLAIALNYLREDMEMDIPAEAIDHLGREPVGLAERIENWSALMNPGKSLFHRVLSDRRLSAATYLMVNGKGARLPGMAARWTVRELSNILAAQRNVSLG